MSDSTGPNTNAPQSGASPTSQNNSAPDAAGLSRRHFLAASGAATAAVAMSARSYAKVIGANERIRIGFIGAGGMGNSHLSAINDLKTPDNVEAVAVADCWLTRAQEGAKKVEAPQAFADFRKVLDIKEIDYVTIATPEHWHSDMTIAALDAGKAVYCEKPMTHTIPQAQAVVKKQKETGLPVQIGVQAMSDDSYSSAAKAIADGVLGQVVQAQIEYVRRYDKQGPWRDPDIKDDTAQPADLDWNAWLGHAPKIGWNPHHYFEWRNYGVYSGGICTDLFIHRITRIMKACGLLYPRRVVGMGGIWQWPDGRDLPDNFEMICEYPRGMTVYVLGTMSNRVGVDHLIRGYRGTLYFTPTGWVAKDKDGKILDTHMKTGGEDVNLHHTNLHRHLRGGEALNCPVELGLAGVVAVNMANESWRTSKMIGWDTANEKMAPADTLNLSHSPEA
jgi:predicted dehydrogenase